MCVDLLHSGKTRKDILQELAKVGKVSPRTADQWMATAKPLVQKRLDQTEALRVTKEAEEIGAIARELSISRRSQLAELKKVAYMDPRKLYYDDGSPKEISQLDDDTAGAIAGIETLEERDPITKKIIGTTKKVKKEPKLAALTEINRMMGWTTPATATGKLEEQDGKGNTKSFAITLHLG